MIRIAVVGDIGSGKTYVAKLFGFPVFNADNEVAKIYKSNRSAYEKLNAKFPEFVNSFPIKKSEVSNAIINNVHNIKLITQIIHPIVRDKMKNF